MKKDKKCFIPLKGITVTKKTSQDPEEARCWKIKDEATALNDQSYNLGKKVTGQVN